MGGDSPGNIDAPSPPAVFPMATTQLAERLQVSGKDFFFLHILIAEPIPKRNTDYKAKGRSPN